MGEPHASRPFTVGIEERDVVYSAAKLFFAYGLGNALTFPMAVGATWLPASSEQDRAELEELVASIRIDPPATTPSPSP